ncbi:endo-1,4-beta-xylanase [Flammeovirga sp. MY04]|uniref:endo-1,4-beta-xylanase n=1 Tax=Flammeovirga sp. MY04 TaxID=1191459 RepID=UPI000806206A|nr:endo-1,4-beta-xylanase [Flammeovirga sp. MY04]ANQ52235.1 endo-1,4-beta-xylanase [Flammeovirga sp. MY04]
MKKLFIYLLSALVVGLTSCVDNKEQELTLSSPTIYKISNLKASSFTADWTSIVNAQSYELNLATDENFTNLVAPYESVSTKEDFFHFEGLAKGQTFYVRVKASLKEKSSDFSSAKSITTLVEDGVEPDTPLKDVATTFRVGMATIVDRLNGTHDEIYKREYNQISAEWEMKMNIMYPEEGRYDFTLADQLVEYAQKNGMEVHGHALIWHAATPDWVENYAGTDEEFSDMVEDYIKTTVTRYKGKVISWDVVNEAIDDAGGNYRNSVFLERMGEGYIQKCFEWAREADPDCLLFYNDYNLCWDRTKLDAVITKVVDNFQSNNVPLDGVGFQMHIGYNGPSKTTIAEHTKLITDKGILMHFSELDVKINPDNDLSAPTEEREFAQKDKVREVVEVYNAIPESSKFALTIWGLRDDESWIPSHQGHDDWPLLYDKDFTIKKAHTGFLEGLQE